MVSCGQVAAYREAAAEMGVADRRQAVVVVSPGLGVGQGQPVGTQMEWVFQAPASLLPVGSFVDFQLLPLFPPWGPVLIPFASGSPDWRQAQKGQLGQVWGFELGWLLPLATGCDPFV